MKAKKQDRKSRTFALKKALIRSLVGDVPLSEIIRLLTNMAQEEVAKIDTLTDEEFEVVWKEVFEPEPPAQDAEAAPEAPPEP